MGWSEYDYTDFCLGSREKYEVRVIGRINYDDYKNHKDEILYFKYLTIIVYLADLGMFRKNIGSRWFEIFFDLFTYSNGNGIEVNGIRWPRQGLAVAYRHLHNTT